jgi:hypothetical protein
MSGDVSPYTSLITSEHASAPNFVATVAASCQPFADLLAVLQSIPSLYDLDNAVGAQLDTVGLWVGVSRNLAEPLTGVYFSFDTAGVGFDQGVWFGPGDSTTTLFALPDDIYRTLLRAKIAANQWDGSIPDAYAIWDIMLQPIGLDIQITDNGDMTMTQTLVGTPDVVTQAIFNQGLLDLKPAGVSVTNVIAAG